MSKDKRWRKIKQSKGDRAGQGKEKLLPYIGSSGKAS